MFQYKLGFLFFYKSKLNILDLWLVQSWIYELWPMKGKFMFGVKLISSILANSDNIVLRFVILCLIGWNKMVDVNLDNT